MNHVPFGLFPALQKAKETSVTEDEEVDERIYGGANRISTELYNKLIHLFVLDNVLDNARRNCTIKRNAPHQEGNDKKKAKIVNSS